MSFGNERDDYAYFLKILQEKNGFTEMGERQRLAQRAFNISSHYDSAIFNWFVANPSVENAEIVADGAADTPVFKQSIQKSEAMRYGENPHQSAVFFGDLTELFETLNGKALSYNNLVDVDAAVRLMREFRDDQPTFAILKHTNACGVATKRTLLDA